MDLSADRLALGAFLLFLMTVSTWMPSVLAVLAPVLADEFDLSRVSIGALGTLLFLTGAATAPLMGHVNDRLGAGLAAMSLVLTSGAALVAMSLARSTVWLVPAMLLAGLCIAGNNPTTNRILASRVSSGRRGWLLGVKQSGVRASQLVVGFLLPIGIVALGWRRSLLVAAVVTVVLGLTASYSMLWRSGEVRERREATVSPFSPSPQLRWLVLLTFLLALAQSPVMLYLPLYAHEWLGLSVSQAGFAVGTMGALGVIARILWGPIAERLQHVSTGLIAVAVVSLVSLGPLMVAAQRPMVLVVLFAIVFGLTGASWQTLANLAVIEQNPTSSTGRGSGLVHMAMMSGLSLGPIVFGWVTDRLGSYHVGWGGVAFLYLVASVVAVRALLVERRVAIAT